MNCFEIIPIEPGWSFRENGIYIIISAPNEAYAASLNNVASAADKIVPSLSPSFEQENYLCLLEQPDQQ